MTATMKRRAAMDAAKDKNMTESDMMMGMEKSHQFGQQQHQMPVEGMVVHELGPHDVLLGRGKPACPLFVGIIVGVELC